MDCTRNKILVVVKEVEEGKQSTAAARRGVVGCTWRWSCETTMMTSWCAGWGVTATPRAGCWQVHDKISLIQSTQWIMGLTSIAQYNNKANTRLPALYTVVFLFRTFLAIFLKQPTLKTWDLWKARILTHRLFVAQTGLSEKFGHVWK